jgi:hypothetical protein
MADGATLPLTGSGDSTVKVVTDDCGAPGHAQGMKLCISTDGSPTFIPADATNGLSVEPKGAALTSLQLLDDVIKTDDAAFTPATDKVAMVGAEVDDTGTDSVDEGDAAALRCSTRRELFTQIRDAAGNERGVNVTAANALKVDGSGVTQPVSGTVTANGNAGDVAHDGVDSGNPVKIGAIAVAHGSNPTAVAAADRTNLIANRAGVQFVIGGHPNAQTIELAFTGAQTDVAIVTVSTGLKIVVTRIKIIADNANTAFPQVRVGFGTANTPTTTGVVETHPGVPAGGGCGSGDGSGIVAIGADNEDLRVTAGAPTGGSIRIIVTYYTIES